MSGKIVGMVFDHYPGGGNEMLLAVKLADNAHDDGTSIYPSVATLATQTRQSERTVQYQLKRMLESGWLELVREARGGGRGGGSGRAREYRIAPVWVKAHDSRVPAEDRPVWVPRTDFAEPKNVPKQMGAKAAPISRTTFPPFENEMGANPAPISSNKWVQPDAEMGATAIAEMGATAIAPEPPLTVIEPNTPQPPAVAVGGSAIDEFINTYPKKVREVAVRRRWARIAPSPELAAVIVASVRKWARTDRWREADGRFVPDPASWLRDKRWNDVMPGCSADGSHEQPADWTETRAGIEAEGERLGLGRWDQSAFDCGRGPAWPEYRRRVIAAHAERERIAA